MPYSAFHSLDAVAIQRDISPAAVCSKAHQNLCVYASTNACCFSTLMHTQPKMAPAQWGHLMSVTSRQGCYEQY